MSEEKTVETVEEQTKGLFDSIKDSANAQAEDDWLEANDAADPDVTEEQPEEHAQEEPQPSDEPEPEPEKAEEPEYTEEEREEYERSLTALRLDGVFDSDELDAMSRDDILKKGSRAAKRQASSRKALEERTARIKELEEAQTTSNADLTSEEPTADLDLSELTQEERDAIPESLLKVLEKSRKDAAARVQQAEKALAERDGWLDEVTWELSRQRIWERFPDMKDPGKYGKLMEKAKGFDVANYVEDGGGLIAAAQAMQVDAAKMLGYQDALADAHREQSEKESRHRSNGTVSGSKSDQKPPKAMSLEEQETWALDMIESGKMNPEEVKRALAG